MAVLDLEERDTDLFVGQTPRTPLQRIFGGQVAGQALMAAGLTLPAERAVHSLHSYFLRPGDPNEEIRYAVERIRDGRAFSTRRVLAHQPRKGEDVAIFALTADSTRPRRRSPSTRCPCRTCRAGVLPSLADVAAHGSPAAAWVERSAGRWSSGCSRTRSSPAQAPPHTETRVWMRVAGRLPDDAAVHAAALTFVSDLTLLGAGLARSAAGGGTAGASLDHAVWFHAAGAGRRVVPLRDRQPGRLGRPGPLLRADLVLRRHARGHRGPAGAAEVHAALTAGSLRAAAGSAAARHG